MMNKSIVFVCHGNICRSPMAEYLFKYISNGKYNVESRATSAEEIGNDMHQGTKNVLKKHNIPFSRHFAKQITSEDYNKFDLIIYFDDYNFYNLKRMFNDTSKIFKLLKNDIDDPWYTGDFDKAYDEINKGCIDLLLKLESGEMYEI